MPRINSRNKGASGEREFCKWLQEAFNLPETPTRNLEQVRSGGADVITPPFAFEVKRVEKPDELAFWTQVKRAVAEHGPAFGLEPVVAYRLNRGKWNFLISGTHIGLDGNFIRLTEVAFKKWVAVYLRDKNIPLIENNSVKVIEND